MEDRVIRLTVERMRRGWTKARLARAAGLDQSLLSKIEAGRVLPYACELERLAAAIGIEPSEASALLEDAEPRGSADAEV
jgi:transcriptional regulator with XRE-family HTH domain